MAGDNKYMKRKNIILVVSAFALLAVIGGGTMSALAATDSTVGRGGFHLFGFMNKKNLTDEEKSALDAKMKASQADRAAKQAAIEAAIAAGDYNAWAKAVGENCPLLKNVTVDNFSKYVQAEKLMKQAGDIYKEIGINKGLGFKDAQGGVPSANGMGAQRGHGLRQSAGQGKNAS